jgi:hypothetical protein
VVAGVMAAMDACRPKVVQQYGEVELVNDSIVVDVTMRVPSFPSDTKQVVEQNSHVVEVNVAVSVDVAGDPFRPSRGRH